MSVKEKRARAEANKAKSAQNEFDKSLHSAERIDDPWKRAQMVAYIARMEAPDDSVLRTVKKVFKAAQETGDPYQRVAASILAVYALMERKKITAARAGVLDLLDAANDIEHPVSKLYALESLWRLAYYLGDAFIKQAALDALIAACSHANSWRAGRSMEVIARTIAAENTQKAQDIIHSMRESRYKRRAQKTLDGQIAETVQTL